MCVSYPTASFEILSSECGEIEAVIFGDDFKLLARLFEFFNQEKIEHIQGSHICKIITVLLGGFTKGVLDFFKTKPGILETLTNHLDLFDMTTFFIKILSLEAYDDEFKEYLIENNFVRILFHKLRADNSAMHVDITNAFVDLLHTEDAAKFFLNEIEKTEILDVLFTNTFSSKSSLLSGTQLIVVMLYSLVENQCLDYDTLPPILEYVVNHIPKFKEVLLEEASPDQYFQLPSGKVNPAGPCKIVVTRLFEALYSIRYKVIEDALLNDDILGVLIQLFFKYDNNSILHKTIDEIISGIFEDDYSVFVEDLLNGKSFHTQLIDYYEERETKEREGAVRNSCIAYSLLMALNLYEASCIHDSLQEILSESERWNSFVERVLSKKKYEQRSYLANGSDNESVGSSLSDSNQLSTESSSTENSEGDSDGSEDSEDFGSTDSEDFFLDLQDKDDIPTDNDFYGYSNTKAEVCISFFEHTKLTFSN